MKLYGIGGVGTGKLGNQVFAVKAGQQIVRQYQPVVSNPNTPAQAETRAKMKLISQVAAIVAPAIVIPAQGLKTKRNNFISANYKHLQFNNGEAKCYLTALDLTKGPLAFPRATLSKEQGVITATLNAEPAEGFTKVVFVFVSNDLAGNTKLLKVASVDHQSGSVPSYSFTPSVGSADVITCLVYGIRPNNEKARLSLSEMSAEIDEPVVTILTERKLLASDVTFSMTMGESLIW